MATKMFLELEEIHNQSFASLEVLNITDVDVARRMQVDLTRGYLFRPKTPSGWVYIRMCDNLGSFRCRINRNNGSRWMEP